MLNFLLSLFSVRPVLENGLADSDLLAVEAYFTKLQYLSLGKLLEEVGVSYKDYCLYKLTKDDIKTQAMQNFIRKRAGYYFEI